jgi:hypothetical protein
MSTFPCPLENNDIGRWAVILQGMMNKVLRDEPAVQGKFGYI